MTRPQLAPIASCSASRTAPETSSPRMEPHAEPATRCAMTNLPSPLRRPLATWAFAIGTFLAAFGLWVGAFWPGFMIPPPSEAIYIILEIGVFSAFVLLTFAARPWWMGPVATLATLPLAVILWKIARPLGGACGPPSSILTNEIRPWGELYEFEDFCGYVLIAAAWAVLAMALGILGSVVGTVGRLLWRKRRRKILLQQNAKPNGPLVK